MDYSDSESEGSLGDSCSSFSHFVDSYSSFIQSPVFNGEQDVVSDWEGGGGVQSGAGDAGPAPSLPISDHYKLSPAWNVYIRKFKIHGKAFHVRFRNIDQIDDLENVLLDIIRNVRNIYSFIHTFIFKIIANNLSKIFYCCNSMFLFQSLTDIYAQGDPSDLIGLMFKHTGLRQG